MINVVSFPRRRCFRNRSHDLSLGFFGALMRLEVLSLNLVRDMICGRVDLME
jgi:hypothetical protein